MPKKPSYSKDTVLIKIKHWFSVCESNEDTISISENEGGVNVVFASQDNSDETAYRLIECAISNSSYFIQYDGVIIKYRSSKPFYITLVESERKPEKNCRTVLRASTVIREQFIPFSLFHVPGWSTEMKNVALDSVEAMQIAPIESGKVETELLLSEVRFANKPTEKVMVSLSYDIKKVVSDRQGLVSITMDDSWKNQFDYALGALDKRDIKATFYHLFTPVECSYDKYMTMDNVQDVFEHGHEAGAHTLTHKDLTTLSPKDLEYEVLDSKYRFEHFLGCSVNSFSPPYGIYNSTTDAIVKKAFNNQRSVISGLNKTTTDPYNLLAVDVVNTFPLSGVQDLITEAANKNLWLILLFHDFVNGWAYRSTQYNNNNFEKILNHIQKTDILPVTVSQGVDLHINNANNKLNKQRI